MVQQISMPFAPPGRLRGILMDPNWPEYGGGRRGAQNHYELQNVEQILQTIRRARMSDDSPAFAPDVEGGCHLAMWATETHYESALWLFRALGFRKVAGVVWVKTKYRRADGSVVEDREDDDLLDIGAEDISMGIGQYVRYAHEHLLIGVCGTARPPPPELRPPSVIPAPRPRLPGTEMPWHSRKPDFGYEYVERMTAGIGPWLEMYSRHGSRHGWSFWGNEAG